MTDRMPINPVLSPGIDVGVDIHTRFGLSYSNYLVLNRSVLQSMPDGWQRQFVAMLDQLHEVYGGLDWPTSYMVQARDTDGRFIPDPIPHYNRGRTVVEPCPPVCWSIDEAS